MTSSASDSRLTKSFDIQLPSTFLRLAIELYTDLLDLISDRKLIYDAYTKTPEVDDEVVRNLCQFSHTLRIFEGEFSRCIPSKAAIVNALENNQPLRSRLTPSEQQTYFAKIYDDGVRVVNSQAVGVERILMQIEAECGPLQSVMGGSVPLVFVGPGGTFRMRGKRKPVFRPEPNSFIFRDLDAEEFLKARDYFQDPKDLESELNQPIKLHKQNSHAESESAAVDKSSTSSVARDDRMDFDHLERSDSDSVRTITSLTSDWQPNLAHQLVATATIGGKVASKTRNPKSARGSMTARSSNTFVNTSCAMSLPPPPADTNKTCTRTNKIRPIEDFDIKVDGTAYATCRHCRAYVMDRAKKAKSGK